MDQALFEIEDGTLLDATGMSPGEIAIARERSPRCALCKKEGQIAVPKTPVFRHDGEHPPDAPERRVLVLLLRQRLQALFPDSKQSKGLFLEGSWADLALVRSNGAKLAVQIIGNGDDREKKLEEWRDKLESQRTEALFLLGAERLAKSAVKEESASRGITIKKAETDLLAMGEPLVYIDETGTLRKASVPEQVARLAKISEKTIGRVRVPLRVYHLRQMEIREGRWWFDTRWDKDIAAPPLPRGLKERIEKAGL